MPGTIPAARQHLIDAIAQQARSRRGATAPLTSFVQAYYRGVDETDLRATEPAALAAAAAGHLRFGTVRRPGEALVRVFNPSAARDGWDAPRTVVEVVTDDMPFLVDSLAMVLNGSGLSIHTMVHPVLGVVRDRGGRLKSVSGQPDGRPAESWQHIEVDCAGDAGQLERLRERIVATLDDVRVAVTDWPKMVARARAIADEVRDGLPGIAAAEAREAAAFVDWLADNHFTFLGYREYRLERGAAADRLVPVARSGLGLLRAGRAGRRRPCWSSPRPTPSRPCTARPTSTMSA
jgi:glutamate dehydrogenase